VTWSVDWSRPAQRDLRRLDQDTARRIIDAVDHFAATGHGDVRPLRGRERQWRLRVGEWRVIFTYRPSDATILVAQVLPRGRAYR
jgi:mRNA interferase RelE/StbE